MASENRAASFSIDFFAIRVEKSDRRGSNQIQMVFTKVCWMHRNLSTRRHMLKKGDFFSWDRCYDFINIFAEKFCEKNRRFGLKTKLNFKKVDHNIGI
jgi:hypothetical protein